MKTKIRGNNLYFTGNVRLAREYYEHIISKLNFSSILDIGCGDAIIKQLVNGKVDYLGVDIGAGCYEEFVTSDVYYISDRRRLDAYVKEQHVDMCLLINVLEHTEDFSGLFELALRASRKYVFVALPNEENIHNLISVLLLKGLPSHTLEMHEKHLNHRHLWFIQKKAASDILERIAAKYGFMLRSTHHTISYPNTIYKRILYTGFTALLPWKIKSRNFALVFEKLE